MAHSIRQPQGLHVSLRDAMVFSARNPSIDSTLAGLNQLGVQAVELEFAIDGSMPKLFGADDTAHSVAVSALLLGTDFAGPDAEAHIDWTLRGIAAAEALGAPAVRIDATHWGPMPKDEIRQRCIHCISRILDQSAGSPVDLAIENHGGISNDPEYLDALFAAVPNRRLGLTLDTGNFYWYGFPLSELYGVIEHFAPRARHTHIKSINYPPAIAEQRREKGFEYGKYHSPLDVGNLDIPRIVRLLHAAGYRRGLCIENEALVDFPVQQRMEVLRRDVATVKEAIAKMPAE